MTTAALKDLRILVTRPVDQARHLADKIHTAGGEPVLLPALEIDAADDSTTATRCREAANYDWLIFISRNAVDYALPLLPTSWPATTKIAAVGTSTAKTLEHAGLPVAVVPTANMNSEGLLAALSDELAGRRVLIVRGVGGREKLAEELQQRGAEVEYAEVYQRRCPDPAQVELDKIFNSHLDVLIATSGETLRNLLSLRERCAVGDLARFYATPLVVVSERVRQLAVDAGFHHTVIVADAPDDDGIVAAIAGWHTAE